MGRPGIGPFTYREALQPLVYTGGDRMKVVPVPYKCEGCGKPTYENYRINDKPICHECWIKFGLTDKLGFDPWEMLTEVGA